ncbi:NAD-dependent epimerase/dehydratase family protein [Actinoplanes friuliensis]|jgi:nucleoside-diphosphate-sugar epimerase|uniref:Putative NAD-dependent epimerase/dehydratase n=1 Tax=Actinoplanes friuliensis DSM 7358 TaxID=1246995 RepID=U5VTU5_9ACTN|nr:NAD-dependent epimerase/dehydratase family protein [Actinoplanes friuliensis]AGZ39125.1 putative NAD-dependent epimerase/dehydratase [Actinoplanes friuliensis DSM 7358]
MSHHVIVGAGPIGSAVAHQLVDQGKSVRMVTRSGSGPEHPLIERVAADATDAAKLTELTRGAEAIYNCANPKYTQWEALWPPLSGAMLTAARETGAVLATTGNLYVYGPVPGGRMTERSPLAATGRKGRVRIKMWQEALASGVRTVEVRGADYVGAGAASIFSAVLLPAIAKGRTAWAPADIDAPHTFTYTGDMARALVQLAADERAHGRAWHVPSPAPISIRELAQRYYAVSGAKPVPLRPLPRFVMRTAGLAIPMAREMAEMDYQFYAPFIMDSTETEQTFGLTPTDLDTALREVAADAEATASRTM